jgi:hypothetical protein
MPVPIAGTAKSADNGVKAASASNDYMSVAGKISKMSSSEFRESLVRAGIITKRGVLKAKYKKK